ncbi:helix-turn-helix transcriptional regulator [Myceligenerans salitolerans]|uniref:Response regulator transcription factor n=1 Tax=Myceligenerans salitolerans TaxID=1230528 RepID=A0ABS3IB44_9MICO|nr:LuxR C-terminal-related transcriptional regulator [Myceligenerans salitolerans]MBO0609841.1 response regulator transcription factor [Myceligenerans salitolerans]
MSDTAVSVFAADRISADLAGAWLRAHPATTLLPQEKAQDASVLLYLTARSKDDPMRLLRRSSGVTGICEIPKVLVAPHISDHCLLEAVGHGVVSFLNYSSTSLVEVTEALVEAARGGSRLSGALTRALTDEIREQRRDTDVIARRSGLEPREIEVLRMLAEGDDVGEIAARLRYSESTVKAVIHAVVKRLGLRNRIEAVAYGARIGAY